jgi:hypothetical protein
MAQTIQLDFSAGLNFNETTKAELIENSKREEEEFRKLVPKTGFFDAYLRFTDRQDGPGSFHFWAAATVLGGALQRRAWINRGIYELFPNIYTVLVAPSGVCRKTRVVNIATELVEKYEWMNVIADKTTPEALLQAMQDGTKNMASGKEDTNPNVINIDIQVDNVGFIRAPELAVFLSKETYSAGMITILTDLFDAKDNFKYLTRNKKPVVLTNTILSLLGGSTPEWLATQLPAASFEGGFMSRIIFVVKHYRDRMIAWPTRPTDAERLELQNYILNIRRDFRGEIRVSDAAHEWFREYYEELAVQPIDDYHLTGFFERKPDTILKLGIILSAAENKELKVISVDHLKQAEKILTWTQERMFRAFDHIDMTPASQVRYKIVDYVEQKGSVTRREVLRKFGSRLSSIRELEEIEKLMDEAGDLDVVTQVATSGKGRPSVVYKKKEKKNDPETSD